MMMTATQQFLITAQRNGKVVFATSRNLLAGWTENLELAYVYDQQDNREFKLKYWRAMATRNGIDAATVQAQEIQPCAC